MKTFEVIVNIPSPYRVYLFEKLARALTERGFRFEANFMAHGHAERPVSWLNPKMSFPHRYWRDFGLKTHHFNLGYIVRSWFRKPDVLLVGSPYDTFTGILAAFTARARIKCTWIECQTKTPGKLDGLIGSFKRFVLSRFDYVTVPGSDAVKYMSLHQARTSLKMPVPVILPNLIDETKFKPRGEWPKEDIALIRQKLGVAGKMKLCLIPARLDVAKGLQPMLDILTPEMLAGWRVIILGHGPLEKAISEQINSRALGDCVRIVSSVEYSLMPLYYAAADLFLLPSLNDQNPLSVVEAIHSGLPIALSDRAGNVEEGVSEGRNGWVLSVLDLSKFRRQLTTVFSATEKELEEYGRFSKEVNASFWNTSQTIGRYLDGLKLVEE